MGVHPSFKEILSRINTRRGNQPHILQSNFRIIKLAPIEPSSSVEQQGNQRMGGAGNHAFHGYVKLDKNNNQATLTKIRKV